MVELIYLGERFLRFFRDQVVPFFTVVPDQIPVIFYNPFTMNLSFIQIPWLFGDTSFAEFILITGLIALIVVRLVKFLTDVIGL